MQQSKLTSNQNFHTKIIHTLQKQYFLAELNHLIAQKEHTWKNKYQSHTQSNQKNTNMLEVNLKNTPTDGTWLT